VATATSADLQRGSGYEHRHEAQRFRLGLPALPTTTIGSFPQTRELRRARADRAAGRITEEAYHAVMAQQVKDVIARQEELGLDVLVHGEPERNDMVQYFAEQLRGFVATRHGWVQSYGSRYVRPPILVGDVSRPAPLTVEWARFAQQQTSRPVKGMLTGPVTMLAWSFVRDDQPRADTARQVALALRDEVADLEAAGIAIVQVDEPALRESLPLRRAARPDYLRWAVDAFRLATGGAADDTQVHTHMCYAEFGDVLDAIIAMDADVVSLEAARSGMAIVGDLARADYPREVGPGVWDIHSPRVPSSDEIAALLRVALDALPAERLWVNPDCGLKTRGYAEVLPALANLVAAAQAVRGSLP
jgi:5-methyltetrahydropteroyltriglutamate--homocysteine methyltransferase